MTDFNYDKIVPGFDREAVVNRMKTQLSDFRFGHCLRVEKEARGLAAENDLDVERAGLAGLLHDYAKERSDDEFIDVIKRKNLNKELLNYGNAIWHGIVGAEIIKDELNVYDEDVLNAIRRHTVGSTTMTGTDKCTFIADFIEPARDFTGIDEAREYADKSLDAGVAFELKHSVQHLINKNRQIYPATFASYNYWINKGEL
ncbi:bis(5'-nucleosyl)-tetraphosphatase (symmetrical) YqeK [Companilactobacillus sp.]|jgi:predicted HD superfamily hydrolase involved in NAD metabolism|uniref:bis(5'-nucleosyl)-tetraphosphatase (symmetrical) YqeK n=1 Tax=Companilactobacillus sp. TaxID=2767905 RepID=UPI0025BC8EE5|nr:bis(5'-nucleosyl)-tetraphosphatase (symmetrical) YqeK [Companilactobacillus sp.]MCH4007989.1 bis(5'-nucleosyl)-tetraphosphatase (symmetrical) YqeK [Companilactobacillus sp.]MCH4051832.1 bis(5'-nucleosyl)-tetraphosphatase (symmetrical) YqeK [Companilactobacillus sp.]MCH4075932.1 bis(5'-nucleosyl)-tetraphosphatase (symmetrical) YqeK [Companilactobacillus sp.]MCH4124507.1 bis(5'-nucleosyl)-tetraphosphatase (symmetrical) YqeK [Companilactobacillus sp.]MCH4132530.1 bis(5'-nucleosyl)-tetraphospha